MASLAAMMSSAFIESSFGARTELAATLGHAVELVTLWVQSVADLGRTASRRPVSELAIVLKNEAGEAVLKGTAALYPPVDD